MAKQVKGTLFRDYVKMIKKSKHIDWTKHFTEPEMEYLKLIILPMEWYPYEIYQKYGAAIFQQIAGGKPELAMAWGKASMDELARLYKDRLVEEGNPLSSLEKFKKLNRRFFDFDGFEIIIQNPNHADIIVDASFGTLGVQGYSHQMLGSFQRLIELSGAQVKGEFSKKVWEGDEQTVIKLSWQD